MIIKNLKIFIYGIFWLILLSPYTIFLTLGLMSKEPIPSGVEIVGILAGTGFYWQNIWMPIRSKMHKYDTEFVKNWMGWK